MSYAAKVVARVTSATATTDAATLKAATPTSGPTAAHTAAYTALRADCDQVALGPSGDLQAKIRVAKYLALGD